ncbi:Cytochrome oxidase biogenesis protein Surf1, facilitates heme A insertion [Microbacterium esteraromaticum]|uniref:SURF1-like protein n=1 Tax=Microbacterium esteraromaticum TaxID=57043 RepID=A0A1R4IXD6_9MICO|nr:SURF1 family protein [Microbacterium esteraromaticum]SJN24205.1 Cytochrome oxidase biogenesis protein Surf1, facilitates heme A insertion [Microbacterium esteraromaticum]
MSQRLLRWGAYVLVAIGFAIACFFLSQWQFDRNIERSTQIELVEQNYDATPVPLGDLVGAAGELDPSDEWHPVALRGRYLPEQQLLVRNRPHGGTSAFEVLVPFQDENGQVLLVDRGWLSSGEDAVPAVIPAPPQGDVTVIVRLRPGEAVPSSGRSAPEGQVPTINLPTIADRVNSELITGTYGQIVSEDPAGEGHLGGFISPTDDPGPHLSYAIQWILFAIMGFAFIGYVIRIEIVKAKEDAGEIPKREPRRRRDRDADHEDALLDTVRS